MPEPTRNIDEEMELATHPVYGPLFLKFKEAFRERLKRPGEYLPDVYKTNEVLRLLEGLAGPECAGNSFGGKVQVSGIGEAILDLLAYAALQAVLDRNITRDIAVTDGGFCPMADTPDPLTFTLKDFERVLALWDCKLNQSSFDADGNFVLPSTCRIVYAPDGQSFVPRCEPQGERSSHEVIVECLSQVRDDLNQKGFCGPNAKQTLAMIRMFDALESVYPQTEILARDAEILEFLDDFKWGLAAGVAVGLVLDDPEILTGD